MEVLSPVICVTMASAIQPEPLNWRGLSPQRSSSSSAYRRDRGHVEGEGWSGGAEEER